MKLVSDQTQQVVRALQGLAENVGSNDKRLAAYEELFATIYHKKSIIQ